MKSYLDSISIMGAIALILFGGMLMFWGFVGFMQLLTDRDNSLAEEAKKYEECVIENNYGMTVMQLYYQNGEYPECDY